MKKNSYIFHAGTSFFFYFAFACYNAMLALYLSDIHFNAQQISLITSSAPLFSIFAQPYLGTLADRFRSPRKVSLVALFITVVMNVIFMFSHQLIILLITSATILALFNAVTPLTDRIGVSSPYDFGKIRLWGSVGYAISAQLCGLVYDVIAPISIFVIFLFGTITVLICILRVNDPEVVQTETKVEYSSKEAYKSLFKNKQYIIFLLISFFFWGACTANFTYISVFIKSVGGTASMVGTYQLFATLFEVPAILATDFIIKKFSYKHIMLFACAMSVVNFVWYATLPNPNLIVAVFVFKGLSTILFTMITVRLIMEIVEDKYVSTAFGLQATVGRGIGAAVVQLIGGKMIDSFSTMTPFYLFLSLLIVTALVLSLTFKEKRA